MFQPDIPAILQPFPTQDEKDLVWLVLPYKFTELSLVDVYEEEYARYWKDTETLI
jgi:hypothetical protein